MIIPSGTHHITIPVGASWTIAGMKKRSGLLARHRFEDGAELSFDGFVVGNQSADHGLFINEETDADRRSGLPAPDLWALSLPGSDPSYFRAK